MSDGVTIPASGTGDIAPKVATDDAGAAGHVQLLKLAISTDGSATLIPATAADGLLVKVTNITAGNVTPTGTTTLATEQIAPTSTATSASIASRSGRAALTLINHGTVDLYVSERATNAGTPATTSAHSVKLPVASTMTLDSTAAVYIFTASGTGACHYVEEY